MSTKADKTTVEVQYAVSRTCDRCGVELIVGHRDPYTKRETPRPIEQSALFEMRGRDGFPIDHLFFDLSGDLCVPCVASFVEWFNSGDGPGWEKGQTWDQIVEASWQ